MAAEHPDHTLYHFGQGLTASLAFQR